MLRESFGQPVEFLETKNGSHRHPTQLDCFIAMGETAHIDHALAFANRITIHVLVVVPSQCVASNLG